MNALLVVNKEKDKTSRDIVNELNKIFNTKKIGHTGTLDPLATGVLVCLFGKYTKLVDLITSYEKEYIATIKLGIKTDTLDITGNIIDKSDIYISKEKVEEVFKSFPKKYNQEVPAYSAVKINGKKLYEYARENIEIELPKREVEIKKLELIKYSKDEITFSALVSKGTYIRSLIEDICKNLGCLGVMSSLIRTKQGNFILEDSYSMDNIRNNNYELLSLDKFLDYPVININKDEYFKISNGNKIDNIYDIKDKVIFKYHNKEVAIYEVDKEKLKPYVML